MDVFNLFLTREQDMNNIEIGDRVGFTAEFLRDECGMPADDPAWKARAEVVGVKGKIIVLEWDDPSLGLSTETHIKWIAKAGVLEAV